MQEENYKLTWHTYSDHLRDMMEAMMINDNFADVTLVTDDRKKIKAHRNILSACSSVFKEILSMDPQNYHPLIYLKGIQYMEMEPILQFIYLGEARFYEERMIEFLDAAKNLDIKELGKSVGDGKSVEKIESNYIEQKIQNNMMFEPIDNCLKVQKLIDGEEKHGGVMYSCDHCDQQFTLKRNLKTHIQSTHGDVKYACNQCDYQATLKNNLSRHIQGIHEGVKYACNQCHKQYTDQSTLTKHIGSVHEGVKYACKQCDKQFTGTNKLARHIRIIHEGVRYACNQCNYEATQQSHLNNHILSVHTLNLTHKHKYNVQ